METVRERLEIWIERPAVRISETRVVVGQGEVQSEIVHAVRV